MFGTAIIPDSLHDIVCCCVVICTMRPAEENDRGSVQRWERRGGEGSLWTSSSCLGAKNREQRGCRCFPFPEHDRTEKRNRRKRRGTRRNFPQTAPSALLCQIAEEEKYISCLHTRIVLSLCPSVTLTVLFPSKVCGGRILIVNIFWRTRCAFFKV